MIESLLNIVNIVLANRGKKMANSISPTSNLRYDLGFDSLDLAELTVRIEADYDVDIFEGGIVNTIGEILEKIYPKE